MCKVTNGTVRWLAERMLPFTGTAAGCRRSTDSTDEKDNCNTTGYAGRAVQPLGADVPVVTTRNTGTYVRFGGQIFNSHNKI